MQQPIPEWALKLPWDLIHEISKEYRLPHLLVGAVIQIESAGNPYAMRYEPGYSYTHKLSEIATQAVATYSTIEQMQKTSYGMMQVMGGVYYEHMRQQDSLWATSMIDPRIGIDFGCRHLILKYHKYGPDAASTYAAYNAGSVRKTAGGQFVNQKHVNNFVRYYRQLTQY